MSNSPRSSADASRSPTSPFFHNLSQRLRKGSIASHNSSQGSEAVNNASRHASTAVTQQKESDSAVKPEDAQSTKRYLLSVIRQDWEYPDTGLSENAALPMRPPISYKSREESMSDLESEGAGRKNPYKYDNPDAIGDSIRQRKRRKRKMIEEEMEWNEGLRFWMLQRDAWTGATLHRPKSSSVVNEQDETKQSASPGQSPETKLNHEREGSASTRASDDTVQSTQSTPSWPLPEKIEETQLSSSSSIEPPFASTAPSTSQHSPHQPKSEDVTASSPTETLNKQSGRTSTTGRLESLPEEQQQHSKLTSRGESAQEDEPFDESEGEGPYLPIYPPLLPQSHALRARIKPAVYSTIYDKVVLQSLTPNVPIPLTNMIGTLVVGWKSEGNWPPPGSNLVGPGTGIAGKTTTTKGKKAGESAFAKWRRDQDERRRVAVVGATVDGADGRERGGRSRRSLSGAMKKVFGFAIGDADRAAGELTEEEKTARDLEEIGLTFSQCEETEQDKEENVQLNKALVM